VSGGEERWQQREKHRTAQDSRDDVRLKTAWQDRLARKMPSPETR
jgi:hypothetical protein